MIGKIYKWVDSRTGIQQSLEDALYENIPGGAKWRYVSGSMLVFAFTTQLITGLFLWMYYSPGTQNAWASVYYITFEMEGGNLLRGIHHIMAQAMICLLPIHLMQVVWERAYTKPREFNWWLGLVLLQLTLALGLTGYLLPWDQQGYWATKVATEMAALPPLAGGMIQKIIVGGSEYGHLTLTRFFALHAGVLPGLLIGFLVLHIAMFRKHGITAVSSTKRSDQYFWPMQVLKDGVACAILFAVVVFAAIMDPVGLGPPAEPAEAFGAARPEWYFLFLFQMLKYFDGSLGFNTELMGAIVFPLILFGFMFMMPMVARAKGGHWLNVGVMFAVIGLACYLTWEAKQEDNYYLNHPDDTQSEAYKRSRRFHEEVGRSDMEFELIQELVRDYGIPLEGPTSLQQRDPLTMGLRLFRRQCAGCHSYSHEDYPIAGPQAPEQAVSFGAPDLVHFGSVQWIQGILSHDETRGIRSSRYFGNTEHREGEMAEYVYDTLWADVESTDDIAALDKQIEQVAWALAAEAELPYLDYAANQSLIQAGRDHLNEDTLGCIGCHNYGDHQDGYVIDLNGYGSADWLRKMISDPTQDGFYDGGSENDRMPAFHNGVTKLLTEREVELLVRFLREDRSLLEK